MERFVIIESNLTNEYVVYLVPEEMFKNVFRVYKYHYVERIGDFYSSDSSTYTYMLNEARSMWENGEFKTNIIVVGKYYWNKD